MAMAAGPGSGICRAWQGMRAGSSGCATSSNSVLRATSAISPCSRSAPKTWKRPLNEVNHLMGLFISALEGEVSKLHLNGICLRVVGDLSPFPPRLQALIASAEARTVGNDRLTLTIAANYGGQWDIRQAFGRWLKARHLAGKPADAELNPEDIDLEPYLAMAYAPNPDLLIRTGGEQRISNFLLWQSAYAELYFTETLWPAFDTVEMEKALDWYAQRERRFGQTSQQLMAAAQS